MWLLRLRQKRRERIRLERERERIRRKAAIRRGKQDFQSYIGDCDRMAAEYHGMAKEALKCGNDSQCDGFLLKQERYDIQSRNFRSMLLTLRDVENSGRMAVALNGAANALGEVSQEMSIDLKELDMAKLVAEINMNRGLLEEKEGQMIDMMDHIDASTQDIEVSQAASEEVALSPEAKKLVQRRKMELLEEIRMDTRLDSELAPPVQQDIDNRLQAGLEKIKNIRNNP